MSERVEVIYNFVNLKLTCGSVFCLFIPCVFLAGRFDGPFYRIRM